MFLIMTLFQTFLGGNIKGVIQINVYKEILSAWYDLFQVSRNHVISLCEKQT